MRTAIATGTALGICLSVIGRPGPVTAQTTQEVVRQPSFTYSETGGCGDLYVFTANADRSEVIWVSFRLTRASSADVLPLPPPTSFAPPPWIENIPVSVGVREYDVAIPTDELKAGLDFNVPQRGNYCVDVVNHPITWPAVAGHLTLTIQHPEAPKDACTIPRCLLIGYPIELRLDAMTFQALDGRRVDLPAAMTLKTFGGHSSGP